MDKINRQYRLLAETPNGDTLEIKLPFTIEFDITRNVLSSANVAQIRIFNLNEKKRDLLRYDMSDWGTFRSVALQAGYGKGLSTIFAGNITAAWPVREGVNFISQIECLDGGYAIVNGMVNDSFPKNTPASTILSSIMEKLPNVTFGAMGEVDGEIARGNAYSGNSVDVINQLAPGKFFIDNQIAYLLGDSECITGVVETINADAGLLGTPLMQDTIVTFDMIFEPRLLVGQYVALESKTFRQINGVYRITGLKHRGVISGATSGSAVTTVSVFKGTSELKKVD